MPAIHPTVSHTALWLALLLACPPRPATAGQPTEQTFESGDFDPLAYRVRHWTSADGLGGDWTECFTQTRDGYLWIGTPEGLVRFDGSRFHRLNRANCPAFDSEVIKALAQDAEGALWVATKRGVLRFVGSDVRRFDVEHGLAGSETAGLCVSPKGGIWVATSGGVSLYRDGRWQSFTRGEGDLRFVHAVLEDRDGRVWLGQPEGLWLLNPGGTVSRQVCGGLIQRHATICQEPFGLPVVESQHFADLPL